MKKAHSKHRNLKPDSRPQEFIRKIISASVLLLLSGFVLQASGVISIGEMINPTAAAQSKNQNADTKKISPEAIRQIEALMNEKESRTPAQQKVDSRLLYTAKMWRGEAIASEVATLETGLAADAKGFIDVEISANVTAGLLKQLKVMNAEIIAKSVEYHSITARIPLGEVESLAAFEDVIFIQPRLESTNNRIEPSDKTVVTDVPMTIAPKKNVPAKKTGNKTVPKVIAPKQSSNLNSRLENVRNYLTSVLKDNSAQLTGTVTSEADTTHRAALARTLSGATGAGLKIGVLSNGVDTLAARQASGDLPATVTVLAGQAGTGDEGTAMLELIHDLAPGAQLYYATANPTPVQFGTNIKNLRAAGCDIIVDDVSYFVESPFQNGQAATVISPGNAGIVTQAVIDVTVGIQAGAFYFSSAANSGNKNDNTAGAWEGNFADGGATASPIPTGNRLHDFGGGVTQNVLTVAGRVLLKWSDPLGGSANDYDLYVLNTAGTGVSTSSTNIQSGTQDPVEDVGNRTVGQRIVIVKKTAAAARFLHLNTNRGALTVSTPGVIYGHNGALNAISVAATPSGPTTFDGRSIGPFPNPHTSANTVETFSSDGPRRIFYNADGTPITPGNVSSTGGQLLQKPDITAADGSATTTPGFIPFYGTSAAAPHAAALMALLKSASPASTNTQLYNAMVSSAIDIEAPGTDRDSGSGIFMPLRAMAAINVPGPAFLERLAPPTLSESGGNGNGRLDPGEVGTLFVRLENYGLADATAISATLTTSTGGVTIVPSATRSYPNLTKAVGTGQNTVPYQFKLADNFPCGASITFTLTVNYAGGTTASQAFTFVVDTTSPTNISTTLDTTAPPSTAVYAASTGTQTGRLARTGVTSNCGTAKAAPGLTVTTGARRYDAYTFTAASSGCITVTLSAATNVLYSAAYNSSGFVPANPNTNYLADAGVSSTNATYSFDVVAGQAFTIVVHEVDVNGGLGLNYSLNVSGPVAGNCALAPTAANAEVSGRVLTSTGRAIARAQVRFNDVHGNLRTAVTNQFGYFAFENVEAGQTYVFQATAKGYEFSPQVISINDDLTGLTFTPIE